MAPISLKVIKDGDVTVTRTVKLESKSTIENALAIVKEKFLIEDDDREYGLFLTSANDELSGIWMEGHRQLDYYMLRDGDIVYYLCKIRNLRVRMLDGSVKTLAVDESKPIEKLMMEICAKIGITNYDEYGFCKEEPVEDKDVKSPGNTGTLTLRRVNQQKEKDAKLEHLSKKLKTDDNVQWLDHHKTLREMAVGPKETLLLKRRLFYSDRRVDSRDPVQLNLLYVQARDAILDGRHPVTEAKAVEFAGIQCQVHYGDFQEEKHKVGLIENLREYVPEDYATSWGIERKIFKEHKKHQGLSSIDAKLLYTKTARDLPTYGVTFFVVKEKQKGKKKLVPRLLGINATSILRLDEVTKEILQVWPLTQVKSYQVGKSETFTLDFGDYSDKEYSVKTNDAVRIRDILQGYIDIIGKRMAAGYTMSQNNSYSIGEDMVISSRGNVIRHVANNPSKAVEESFVGPTKIISEETGTLVSQGTQIVTVQQMLVTNAGSSKEFAITGEVPLRKDMSIQFVRLLNKMNSNSVKIVTLLTESDENKINEAQKIVESMEADLPNIISGVNETVKQQTNEQAKKKLLDELKELCDSLDMLKSSIKGADFDAQKAQDAASKIADLSTQMYFSLDPRTKRRSELLRRSRQSFIEDEKTIANLRRSSLIAAAASATSAVDNAKCIIEKNYSGDKLGGIDIEELEKAVSDKMGKLNAAVALYLMAHSDPNNIDYSAAITSMNTINELLPELAEDALALGNSKDTSARQDLIDDIKRLCEATRLVCLLTGCTDHEKIQEVGNTYAGISGKLVFTFNRGASDDYDNKIIDLAKDVGDKTSILLVKANHITSLAPADPASIEVDAAGVRCADAAKDLLVCAMLTSPSIYEPHCQSALTAAAETLSTAAQNLINTSKPLIEDPSRHHHGEELRARSADLAKVLDKLKNAYGDIDKTEKDLEQENQRFKFIATMAEANKSLNIADKELNKPLIADRKKPGVSIDEAERDLAQKIAQLNSAIAALITATSDRENLDYETAEIAMDKVNELLPQIVKDFIGSKDEDTRAAMLADIKKLCDATRAVYASVESGNQEDLNESALRFSSTSNKLYYDCNRNSQERTTNQDNERQIITMTTSACDKTSQLLAKVYQLAEESNGKIGATLDGKGAVVADAAKSLLTTAQLTAATIEEPRCQSVLLSSANALSSSVRDLAAHWEPLKCSHSPFVKELEKEHVDLQQELENLQNTCQNIKRGFKSVPKEQLQLQYTNSAAAAMNVMLATLEELDKPQDQTSGSSLKGEAAVVQQLNLSQKIGQLNAALAALTAATSNRNNPDYVTAQEAISTISDVMPYVVKEMKIVAASKDIEEQKALLENLRTLCNVTQSVCECAGQDATKINNLARTFAKASDNLAVVVNRRKKPNQILDISQSVYDAASKMVKNTNQLAKMLDDNTAARLLQASSNIAATADALEAVSQLTASCIKEPNSQTAFQSSKDNLLASAQELEKCWLQIQDPIHMPMIKALHKEHQKLIQELEKLESASKFGRDGVEDVIHHNNQYLKHAAAIKKLVLDAEKELEQPMVSSKTKDETTAQQQMQLSQKMAQLNAALAALASANADPENPDYEEANKALMMIKELTPYVVKNTNVVSAETDDTDRAATLTELRSLCDAIRQICDPDTAQKDDNELRIMKATRSLGKLYFVVNPNTNRNKEIEIVNLSKSACKMASQLLTHVYQLAEVVGGESGSKLDEKGAATADAAKSLLTAIQLTGPYIQTAEGRSMLMSSIESLSTFTQKTAEVWSPIVQNPQLKSIGSQLRQSHQNLEHELNKIKEACQDSGKDDNTFSESDEKRISLKEKEDEKTHQEQFLKYLINARRQIEKAEENIKDVRDMKTSVRSDLGFDRKIAVQKSIEEKLARANAAVATILACKTPEITDYSNAMTTTNLQVDLISGAAQDMKIYSGTLSENKRKVFLDDAIALFDATKLIFETMKKNGEELNEAAVDFGNKSAKLFYSINSNVDPSCEKDVILRAREIGDSASRIAMCSSQLLDAVDKNQAQELCADGRLCADAASSLVYTAKLMAPFIEVKECQETLKMALQRLSSCLNNSSSDWQALGCNPKHKPYVSKLSGEAEKLKKLLQVLNEDLEAGRLIKERQKRMIELEDMPLRKLALAILENAKKMSTCTSLTPNQNRGYSEYVKALEDAIEHSDSTNAACKMSPHDIEKSQSLDNAVQRLQVTVLQMRPSLTNKTRNNIIDLSDFVKELSYEAEQLISETSKCSSDHQDIKDLCHDIDQNAKRLMHPSNDGNRGDGTTIDDINEVDKFGLDCEAKIKEINLMIQGLSESKDKLALYEKLLKLEDCCNMLRFATQSALATTEAASLDETVNDLMDLERKVDMLLSSAEKPGHHVKEPVPWNVRLGLVTARPSTSALFDYIDELRPRTNFTDAIQKNRLKDHIKTLLHLMKTLCVMRSRRVATWQDVAGPDVAAVTEQIVKEINMECQKYESYRSDKSVLDDTDLSKLLSTESVKVEGEKKHVEAKLQQTATKLSSMISNIIASVKKPDSLSRSLHVTADTAATLAALGRTLKDSDAIQNAKIEDAVNNMTLQTYNVLKSSDLVSQDPDNPIFRRRLLDAYRLLNDALNKLARVTTSDKSIRKECDELTRNLQMQQGLLLGAPQPTCGLSYGECIDALQSQQEVIQKLNSDDSMSSKEFGRTLSFVTSAVNNSTEVAVQCAYLLMMSENDKNLAKTGVVDVQQLNNATESARKICFKILRSEPEQAKEEKVDLVKQMEYLKQTITENAKKTEHMKDELEYFRKAVEKATSELLRTINEAEPDEAKINSSTLKLLDAIKCVNAVTEHPSLLPRLSDVTTEAKQKYDDVLKHSRDLTSKMISLVREVKTSDDELETMTWVMFNSSRKDVLKVFEALVNSVKENGKKARVLESSQCDMEMETSAKSFLEEQLQIANNWLKRPHYKEEVKMSGEEAVHKVIGIAKKMASDMNEVEKDELCHLIGESQELLSTCSVKYEVQSASLLIERLKELKKCIERGVVDMVVEELIEGQEPLADLEMLIDAEKEESKRKFLLEKKIAELLAQLSKVTKTAKLIVDVGSGGQTVTLQIEKCTQQAELLAPMLVKAAHERVNSPDDNVIIEKYRSILAQYAESLSKVRNLCDQSVDPMDFVQTAGEYMQRIREESNERNDPYKCAYASTAMTKLATRVINVSMSSRYAKQDPELQQALANAQKRLIDMVPAPNTRSSQLPDWKSTTAEILRTTGEVESVLGGENIFKKQPEPDQPIFAAAFDLHAAVRDWSAKDNEIVAVAKRMAVSMARLSEHMKTDRKRDLIATSKSILNDSHEVAELARKLAHECTDIRIKNNLLQVCDRIPTISGQLKMLTTIKGSSLGHQGSKEDQESIVMLVDNAQNLMSSIQEVVKVAAGASVKIMSQRGGPRVRWVRKNYY